MRSDLMATPSFVTHHGEAEPVRERLQQCRGSELLRRREGSVRAEVPQGHVRVVGVSEPAARKSHGDSRFFQVRCASRTVVLAHKPVRCPSPADEQVVGETVSASSPRPDRTHEKQRPTKIGLAESNDA